MNHALVLHAMRLLRRLHYGYRLHGIGRVRREARHGNTRAYAGWPLCRVRCHREPRCWEGPE